MGDRPFDRDPVVFVFAQGVFGDVAGDVAPAVVDAGSAGADHRVAAQRFAGDAAAAFDVVAVDIDFAGGFFQGEVRNVGDRGAAPDDSVATNVGRSTRSHGDRFLRAFA